MEAAVERERGRLATIARDIDLMRTHWQRLLREGKDRYAETVLTEIHVAQDRATDQAQAVAAAQARVEEWTLAPNAFDAALEFFTEVRDLITGRIRQARSTAALTAALSDLLLGVWADVDDADTVRARVVLRAGRRLHARRTVAAPRSDAVWLWCLLAGDHGRAGHGWNASRIGRHLKVYVRNGRPWDPMCLSGRARPDCGAARGPSPVWSLDDKCRVTSAGTAT